MRIDDPMGLLLYRRHYLALKKPSDDGHSVEGSCKQYPLWAHVHLLNRPVGPLASL